MTEDPIKLIIASAVVGCVAAIVWLGAPLVPAVIGGVGGAAALYFLLRRSRR